MTLQPLDREPTQITAGDSVSFTASHPECAPADGWAITYRLFGPLGTSLPATLDVSLTGAVDGGAWLVTLAASDTSDVVSDATYRLVGRATNATTSEALTLYDAAIRVMANPIEATPSNLLTHEERTLTLIEAAIEGRIPSGMESYQINGRAVTKIPMKELLGLRATYRHQVWKKRNPGKSAVSRQVRFGAVG